MSSFTRSWVLVAGLLAGVLLTAFAAPAPAAPARSGAAHVEKNPNGLKDKSVTVQLRFVQKSSTSTDPYGDYYYCNTIVFAPFVDIDHWDIGGVFYYETSDGEVFERFNQLYKPYDDAYPHGANTYPPAPGTHQALISDINQNDSYNTSIAAECAESLAQAQARFGTTAKMLYHPDSRCRRAAASVGEAKKAVKQAKEQVANTTGQAHAQAQTKLNKAEAKLKKAKKKFKKNCPKP